MNTHGTFLAFGLSLVILAGCSSATTPAADTTEPRAAERCAWARGRVERLPVLVLEEHGGWDSSRYPATDTPTFALYDDGLVLFVDGVGERARVLQAHLSPAQVDRIVRDAHAKLAGLPDLIAGSGASDQPSVTIRVQTRGPTRTIVAWGMDRAGGATDAGRSIPAAFVELHATLLGFRTDGAEPWVPDEIAIRLHPRDGGDETAAQWPRAVPLPPEGASEPPPRTHPDGRVMARTSLRYHIDGRLEDAVLDALAELGELPTVRWQGKIWTIHVSRVVPG